MKKEALEDLLFTLQVILNWMVFENELRYLPFIAGEKYWEKEKRLTITGCFVPDSAWEHYEYNHDFLNWLMKTYPKESTNELIDFVHHEMVHYYCHLRKIDDVNKKYHTEAFKLAIERFHGDCLYYDDETGWCDTQLNPQIREKVKKVVRYMSGINARIKEKKHE